MSGIVDRLKEVLNEIPSSAKLVAVSKFHPNEEIMEAYNAGQRRFGENRPQELMAKAQSLPKDIEWHFIGTLQRNKLKMVLPYAYLIHSVDSVRLFEDIVKHAPQYCSGERKQINVLLQYRIAKEESKQGMSREEILDLLDSIAGRIDSEPDLKLVNIMGLMGMATFVEDVDSKEGRAEMDAEFSAAQKLFNEIKSRNYPFLTDFKELSMGMTEDFHIALEYGSTYVRIGTRIFGPRNYQK